MPTRAWEFAIGGLIAIGGVALARLPARACARRPGWVGRGAAIGSIVLIEGDVRSPAGSPSRPSSARRGDPRGHDGPTTRARARRARGCSARGRCARSAGCRTPGTSGTGRCSSSPRPRWGDLGTPVPWSRSRCWRSCLPRSRTASSRSRCATTRASSPCPRAPCCLGAALSRRRRRLRPAARVVPGGGALATAAVAAPVEGDRGPAPAATPTEASPSPDDLGQALEDAQAVEVAEAERLSDRDHLARRRSHARPDRRPRRPAGDLRQRLPPRSRPDELRPTMRVRRHRLGAPPSCSSATATRRQWFPALRADRDREERVAPPVVRTKSGCPAPDVTILQRKLSPRVRRVRRVARDRARRLTGSDKPALVVAAGTRTESLVDRGDGSRLDGTGRAGAEWQAGWGRTLARLDGGRRNRRRHARHPMAGQGHGRVRRAEPSKPTACDVIARCARLARSTTSAWRRSADGATGVDLSDVICDADRCPATHGKYLVYRDTDHLTATFARALGAVPRAKQARSRTP